MDVKNRSIIRVLMFPWLAHGHISPFLELAKKLSSRNFYIYFCSTPVNIAPIKEKLTQLNFSSIELVELHLPSLPELPPQCHTTKGLPYHLMGTLKKAFDMASPTFSYILTTLNPDLLISDFVQPWAPELALSHNIPAVQFTTGGANSFKNSGTFVSSRSNNIYDHETDIRTRINDLVFQCLERSSNVMLVKSFIEFEAKYIDDLSVLTRKKIVAVGPLVQDPSEEDEKPEITEWLDKKEPSSVVFVSFGSEWNLSQENREELAHGLLLSKVNFIWVLRFGPGMKISVKEALPDGFIEMVGEKGLVVEDWAPQKRILSHSSIGGFVSHCGWSSVMESMKFGVPIIAMPMHLDQPSNAGLAVDVGVGLEIKRDKNGNFEREEVAKVIKEVVMEKTGENIRSKARQMSDCIREKGEKEIDELADELSQLCGLKLNRL